MRIGVRIGVQVGPRDARESRPTHPVGDIVVRVMERGSQAKSGLRSTWREAGEAWLTRQSTAVRTDMPES